MQNSLRCPCWHGQFSNSFKLSEIQKRKGMPISLDKLHIAIYILHIAITGVTHETWRQTPLPPCRRRLAARLGPFDDSTGTGHRHEERDRPRFEPGVSLANREWRPAPSNAHHAPAAGAILPRLSRFSGGRSGGLYARTSV